MVGIDTTLPFLPLNIAVGTVSDTRTIESDKSGDLLISLLTEAGHHNTERAVVHDDVVSLRSKIAAWIAQPEIDVILTTGGTGLTGRDVTPEAIMPLFEKQIDGFSIAFHMISYEIIKTSTLHSRACAGIANSTYIFCLPGSPNGCRDGWNKILKWQLDSRYRPCNFVSIIPRLSER
ncbi:MAG: Molybdenum cofactor biosynthesis protein B [Hyphomicrobiaceae bacterium hypho_1]